MNATITHLPGSAYPWRWGLRIVRADADTFHAFIADLKRHIPARSRKWDVEAKRWLLRNDQIATVCALLSAHGLSFAVEEPEEAPAHRQLPMNREQAAHTLYLLPTAPPYVVTAAYKALAKHLHPDRAGGSTEAMQLINTAVEILRTTAE